MNYYQCRQDTSKKMWFWLLLCCCSLQISKATDRNKEKLKIFSNNNFYDENSEATTEISKEKNQNFLINLPNSTLNYKYPNVSVNSNNSNSRISISDTKKQNQRNDFDELHFQKNNFLQNFTSNFSRKGNERDLLVVLPVMQGNQDMSKTKLESFYTKAAVTKIIHDDSTSTEKNSQLKNIIPVPEKIISNPQEGVQQNHTRNQNLKKQSSKITTKLIIKNDNNSTKHHPYTDFLYSKSTPKSPKSPLDYGYPDTLKFVEELNELPKNHKPEWATSSEVLSSNSNTIISNSNKNPTKNNPFEMFESVKPLEINKLTTTPELIQELADMDSYSTDSIHEESVTHQIKTSNNDVDEETNSREPYWYYSTPSKSSKNFASSTTNFIGTVTPISPTKPTLIYIIEDVTDSSKKISNTFLPTPILSNFSDYAETNERPPSFLPTRITEGSSANIQEVDSTNRRGSLNEILKGSTSSKGVNKGDYTREGLNNSKGDGTGSLIDTYEISTNLIGGDSTNKSSLNFGKLTSFTNKNKEVNFTQKSPPFIPLSTRLMDLSGIGNRGDSNKLFETPISTDMLDTNMKNVLISLGIIKSPFEVTTIPNIPTKDFKPVTEDFTDDFMLLSSKSINPTINPEAYINFKKIPVDIDENEENPKKQISNDMKEFLASFGILPKDNRIGKKLNSNKNLSNSTKNNNLENKIDSEVRIDFDDEDDNKLLSNSKDDRLSVDVKNALENLELLQREFYVGNLRKSSDHVFRPSDQLEELNKENSVEKINDVIKTIKKLSDDKETKNLSADEIKKRLENITALLNKNGVNTEAISDVINNVVEQNLKDDGTTKKSIQTERIDFQDITTPGKDQELLDSLESRRQTTILDQYQTTTNSGITKLFFDAGSNKFKNVDLPNILTENKLKNSDLPNPLSSDELIELLENNKNEVKRQEPTTSEDLPMTTDTAIIISDVFSDNNSTDRSVNLTITSNLTTTSESISTSTEGVTMMENVNAPIPELAASFGGGETASQPPSAQDNPTPRPNGLYFYVDWNTFLNVGEEERRAVNIRFAPKAGNPRNFLPITFP